MEPEIAILDGGGYTYRPRGSLAIDVLEINDRNNICIYDYKTGNAQFTEEFRCNFCSTKRALYLGKLLVENEARIPQLLHDWERHSVETNRSNKHWKPTPFPCEEHRATPRA